MSARLSTIFPLACSGDIYAAVPRIIPAWYAGVIIVGECDGSLISIADGSMLGEPKVQHLTLRRGVTFNSRVSDRGE